MSENTHVRSSVKRPREPGLKTIFRTDGKVRSYTCLANTLLQDQTIGWDTRGMLCDLLSRPTDWEISVSGLVAMTKVNGKARVGKDRVWRMVNEAISAGYMARSVDRDKSGKITAVVYIVSDDQKTLRELVSDPHRDLPSMAEPSLDNPPQQSKDRHKAKKVTKQASAPVGGFSLKTQRSASEVFDEHRQGEGALKEQNDAPHQEARKLAKRLDDTDRNHMLNRRIFCDNGYAELDGMMRMYGAERVEQEYRSILLEPGSEVRRKQINSWKFAEQRCKFEYAA